METELGPKSVQLNCWNCYSNVRTRTKTITKKGCEAGCAICWLGLCFPWLLCCLPCLPCVAVITCFMKFQYITHTCPNCGALIAKYVNE